MMPRPPFRSAKNSFFQAPHSKCCCLCLLENERPTYRLWDLFQLAWLAAATLHDAAYPLEVLPDVYTRIDEVTQAFGTVARVMPSVQHESVAFERGSGSLDSLSKALVRLGTGFPLTFLDEHFTFPGPDLHPRVNHGIARHWHFLQRDGFHRSA